MVDENFIHQTNNQPDIIKNESLIGVMTDYPKVEYSKAEIIKDIKRIVNRIFMGEMFLRHASIFGFFLLNIIV